MPTLTCKYCGETPTKANHKGIWGVACSRCKAALTKKLKTGDYGDKDGKPARRYLRTLRLNPETGEWREVYERRQIRSID